MDLSLVLLHHGTPDDVTQTLRSLSRAWLPPRFEVLVLNNGRVGANDLVVVPSEIASSVRFFEIPNEGYPAGVNFGMRLATGKVLAIVTDVAFHDRCIKELMAYLSEHPKVGIVAPRLQYPNGRVQDNFRVFPRFWDLVFKRTFLGKLFARRLHRYLMWHKDPKISEPVDWLTGAFQMITREAWEKIGPKDERYFLFMSDVDLCRTAWAKGFEVHFVGSAEAIHKELRLSAGGFLALLRWQMRQHVLDAARYFWKYLGKSLPALAPSVRFRKSV